MNDMLAVEPARGTLSAKFTRYRNNAPLRSKSGLGHQRRFKHALGMSPMPPIVTDLPHYSNRRSGLHLRILPASPCVKHIAQAKGGWMCPAAKPVTLKSSDAH